MSAANLTHVNVDLVLTKNVRARLDGSDPLDVLGSALPDAWTLQNACAASESLGTSLRVLMGL